MIWIFVAATIFGGAFLIPMVLGGLASELGDGFGGDVGDGDLGGGLDVDVDVEVDLDVDGAGVGSEGGIVPTSDGLDAIEADVDGSGGGTEGILGDALGSIFASLISFRTVVFFSAFFGTSGLVFSALGYSTGVTLGTAILLGVVAAVANSLLFGLIRNSQPNSQISDRTLEGRRARVVLPMDGSQRGRIRIDLSGQSQYIVARPIEGHEQRFDVGASVVVVKIEQGTALIASLSDLELGEE